VTTVPVQSSGTRVRRRTLVDRLLSVFPVVALALTVLVFYLVEAWTRKTPWVFTDELEWTQISRSIASTGHAARRGDPIFFKSVYAYVIAPFWWIHSTSTAYAAIKYANAVIMSLAAVPTYLLSRMLVSRRTAIVVAAAAVAIPGMAYATSIVPESLAYPYFALCSWLAVRALRSNRRLDIAIALVFLLGGYFVHQTEFTTLPAAFVIAGAALWFTGSRGHAMRRNWTRGDTVGFFVLLAGALFLFNRVVLQHIYQWQVTTQYDKNRMIDLGLDGALSLAVGLGILPVIGGLTSLRLPERRGDPTYRAYVAWTATVIAAIAVYTADKAAYNSTHFGTYWEERPLIFLSPLLLLGTAMALQAKRLDKWAVGGATALVGVMVLFKTVQLGWPYYEAPGSAIPGALAYYRGWTQHDVRISLIVMLGLSLGILLARRWRALLVLTVAVGFVWMLAGEITMTVGIDRAATQFRGNLPADLSWVDHAVHGGRVTFLGQGANDLDGENLAEFWNRSVKNVDGLDGPGPGPGPTNSPILLSPDGRLSDLDGTQYVLADSGVVLDAQQVAHPANTGLVLYRHTGPWHLLDTVQQVYSDSWCPNWCSYTYFKPHQHGTLVVTLGRQGYNGSAPPAKVRVVVGSVLIDKNHATQIADEMSDLHLLVPNGSSRTLRFSVETPVRVEVSTADTTLIPPSAADNRTLGVQADFSFKPTKP
jgi:hypothetical protein